MIRKATAQDLCVISDIYEAIHSCEEQGLTTIGWIRGVYPTASTARASLERDDLFVEEIAGEIVAAAIINQTQVPVYADAAWKHPAPDEEVMVLHTLTVSPCHTGHGYGKQFVTFYEQYALEHGCHYLRMDTNVINKNARRLYQTLGYAEIGIVPCEFNGIPGVQLVCLEKKL